MKVLFAVNNDNVSEAIAKKYEKEYKDILSYKNVYYFNAIIRELQKDKTYNRIVISEDLEPFANNNYDMIDKFLLEKYSNISKEAKTMNEERIEVILLCADRRRKAEDMFIKMYNLEIYNAIIGQDRSIEEVCKLIYSPRDKNIAKQYYEIPISDLSGQDDSENNVSEAEVENILAHYKRLGKNEDKYVDSFNNIISQYTDTQLKIIIKYLPIHVKAVLEERSAKYQQLVTSGLSGQNVNFDAKANKYKQKTQKKGGFWRSKNDINDENDDDDNDTIIDREFTTPKMSKPIVIPSDMNTNNVQRINTPNTMGGFNEGISNGMNSNIESSDNFPSPDFLREESNTNVQVTEPIQEQKQPIMSESQISDDMKQEEPIQERPTPQEIVKPEVEIRDVQVPTPEQIVRQTQSEPEKETAKTVEKIEELDLFETSEEQGNKAEQTKVQQVEDELFSDLLNTVQDENKEMSTSIDENATTEKTEQNTEPVKRGRGRPRTKPIVEVDPNKPKRGRGRPRKIPVEQLQGEQLEVKPQEEIKQEETVQKEIKSVEQENDLFNISENLQEVNTEINKTQTEDITNNESNEDVDLFNMEETQTEETPKTDNELLDLFDMNMVEPSQENTSSNITGSITSETEISQEQYAKPQMQTETENIVTEQYNNIQSTPIQQPIKNYEKVETDTELFNRDSSTVNLFEGNNDITTTQRTTSYSSLNTLLTADKKIVAFVGTTKNGTSFVVNNTAEMLSSMGISTAILDLTKSKNSYYIYTNNEEELRNISTKCMKNLENGIAEGLKITKTLAVYTEMPGEEEHYNIDNVLSTLVQNYSAVLIDTDFDTPAEIFDRVQEIYLVQSMDVLTIQPLTAFLRNLKSKNILRQEKLRIVINKSQRIKSLNVKTLIGGMSCYNAPNMSYMTELFDKDSIRYCEIPFETQNYIKYLESLVICSITLSGYTKTLLASLKELANIVYPLVGKQTYSPMSGNKKDPFSKQMSNTLNKMKNKGY